MRFSRLCCTLLVAVSIAGSCPYFLTHCPDSLPEEFEDFIKNQEPLPHYAEAFYSPLGRSPLVDAVLGTPFYFPVYAQLISKELKQAVQSRSLLKIASTSFRAAGIPIEEVSLLLHRDCLVPEEFTQYFEPATANLLYQLWQSFVQVYQESERILSPLTTEEKMWISKNYATFFFGTQDHSDYDFFTSSNPMPLKFFQMAARIDLAKLAECACKLACIVDYVYQNQVALACFRGNEDFEWTELGLKLHISNREQTTFDQNADFFIALGGHNTFITKSQTSPASLQINFKGNNEFIGSTFSQGCGCLGVGVLVNFEGTNVFYAKDFSQGCGFFGSGILANYGGHNQYEIDFFGQSSATFGSALLWDQDGECRYFAREGMAQAASSTLGVSFLINSGNQNVYIAGTPGQAGKRAGGIGQGGSTGFRFYPWIGNASLYGGAAFLYSMGAENQYTNGWIGQGSAYFLGAGLLVDDGGKAIYKAEMDSQGQGLHLSAGLLLEKGDDNLFNGGWGSLGSSADRSVGMVINTGSNNTYIGTVQNQGTARKPKSLGVLVSLKGNNSYSFEKLSNGNLQFPSSPLEWPRALFMTFGKNNSYSLNVDHMHRGPGLNWGIPKHSHGFDRLNEPSFDYLMEKFPPQPILPFDPINGWFSNTAYRPLIIINHSDDLEDLIAEIPHSNYDRRRQLYESIDLFRFTHPQAKIDLSVLLSDPATAPEDQFNYAAIWGTYSDKILKALKQGLIQSDHARQMAIRLVGTLAPPDLAIPVLAKVLNEDHSDSNRAYAAYYLARIATSESLAQLSLDQHSELVRYMAARGLRNSTAKKKTLSIVKPLFKDESFYVRRAAAMTAISLHDKAGIPILLETLEYNTLDTSENYGDNLYEELAKYVNVNFGTNKDAWLTWWQESKESFEFSESAEKKLSTVSGA